MVDCLVSDTLQVEIFGNLSLLTFWTGTGTRLAAEIGAIIERTLGWIEHDMDRKTVSPSERASSANNARNSTSTPLGSETPNGKSGTSTATNGNGFYDAALGGSTTPYPSLGYDESAGSSGPVGSTPQVSQQNGTPGTSFDPTSGTPYQMYTTAGAPPTGLLTTPTLPSNNMEQSGTPVTNPLIAFASQATQHVINAGPGSQQPATSHAEDAWRRTAAAQQAQQLLAATAQNPAIMTGNTWHDWAAAIADSQDRFSANTLLTLGGGRAVDGLQQGDGGQNDAMNSGLAGVGLGVSFTGVGSTHTAQWPLLLFPHGTGSGGGG